MRICKRISAVCFLVAGLACGHPVLANSGSSEDNVIRVLGIHNGTLDEFEMALQLQVIVDSWGVDLHRDLNRKWPFLASKNDPCVAS